VKFDSAEEFEAHVHKCFGRIFELLTKVDHVVSEAAEMEEREGKVGTMNDVRDWVEEAILHCHLAWQYHRLSKGSTASNPWTGTTPSSDGKAPSD
jgi:hypothetical protein